MTFWKKKLITVITEKTIEEPLIESLTAWGVKGYTVTDARGQGHRGVRRAEWDQAANIRLEIVTDEKNAEALCEKIRANYYENYAMILFVSDVQTLRSEKF